MRRIVKLLLTLLLVAVLQAGTVRADIVYLEGGGRVEGVVTDQGSEVTVAGLNGSVVVRKSKIIDVQKTPFITEIYAEKRSRIDDRKANEHYRLGMWCRRNGLKKHADAHLRRALEIDPDHADTRATLGHVRWKDVWLTREEAVDASMAERGFIRYQGRWFTEAGLLAFLDARREEQKIEAEAERRRVEREALARKVKEEEERLKLLAAQRKVVEDALAAAQQTRRERDELLLQNRDLIDLLRDRSWNNAWYGGWGWYGAGYVGGGICNRPVYPTPYGRGFGLSYRRGSVRIGGAFR